MSMAAAYMRLEDQMQNHFNRAGTQLEENGLDSFFSSPAGTAHFGGGKLPAAPQADVSLARRSGSASSSYHHHSPALHISQPQRPASSASFEHESSASPRSATNPMDITRICIHASLPEESERGAKGHEGNGSSASPSPRLSAHVADRHLDSTRSSAPQPLSPFITVDSHTMPTGSNTRSQAADLVRATPAAQYPYEHHYPYGAAAGPSSTSSFTSTSPMQAAAERPSENWSSGLPHQASQSNGSQDSATANALISLSNHEQRSPTTALLKRKLSSISSPTTPTQQQSKNQLDSLMAASNSPSSFPDSFGAASRQGDAGSIGRGTKRASEEASVDVSGADHMSSSMTTPISGPSAHHHDSKSSSAQPVQTSLKRSSPSAAGDYQAVADGDEEDGSRPTKQRRKPGAWRDPSGFRKGITTHQMIDIDAPTRPKKVATKDTSAVSSPSRTVQISTTSPSVASAAGAAGQLSSLASAVSPRIAELRSPTSSAMSSVKSEDPSGANADDNDLLLDEDADELGSNAPGAGDAKDLDAVGKKRRQNTIAARRSRQRKLEQVRQLERNVQELSSELNEIRARMARVAAENENLKHERDESVGKLWIGRAWVHKRPELSEPTKLDFLREIGLE